MKKEDIYKLFKELHLYVVKDYRDKYFNGDSNNIYYEFDEFYGFVYFDENDNLVAVEPQDDARIEIKF